MKHIYLAGGGTGGHIYPALAVASEILRIEPTCKITYFCSDRPIDSRILKANGFGNAQILPCGANVPKYFPLGVRGFSKDPYEVFLFLKSLWTAKKDVEMEILYSAFPWFGILSLNVKKVIKDMKRMFVDKACAKETVLFCSGGFVSAPAVFAARSLKIPVAMLNIDAVAGKANKLLAYYAKDIFVQFEETGRSFGANRRKITVTGCPLRSAFFNPDKNAVIAALGLSPKKKVLLVTGASGGAANINNVMGYLLDKLEAFAADWQIVHLAGIPHFEAVRTFYKEAKISHKILDYFDDMPNLLAAADLVIGRAGAMSVAEFAASQTPAVCLPYPYHRDRHQKLNAQYLVDAGSGCLVDDLCDTEKTAQLLWPVLCDLMSSDEKRQQMKANSAKIVNPDAAAQIAQKLLNY